MALAPQTIELSRFLADFDRKEYIYTCVVATVIRLLFMMPFKHIYIVLLLGYIYANDASTSLGNINDRWTVDMRKKLEGFLGGGGGGQTTRRRLSARQFQFP